MGFRFGRFYLQVPEPEPTGLGNPKAGYLSRVVPVLPDPEIQNSEGTGRLKVFGRRLQLVRCAYLLS